MSGSTDCIYCRTGAGWHICPSRQPHPADATQFQQRDGAFSGAERSCSKCYANFPLGHIHVCSEKTKAEPMQAEGYDPLASVLVRAFDQAARGKGKERHANDEPFTDQVIMKGARMFGHGSLLFQAFKKSEESQRLPKERAVAELLGAIVYLASAVIALEEKA